MATYKKRPNFFDSEEGVAALAALQSMVADSRYYTEPSYSSNVMLYPDNLIPFIDKHMCYLRDHPSTEPRHYISNLRLKTKAKGSTPVR